MTQDYLNSPEKLDKILEKYPWFTTARIKRSARACETDPLLCLNLLTKPWPAVMLYEQRPETITATENNNKDITNEIIDRFLAGGDKKIVPTDETPTDDVSEDSTVFVPDEELDTEELERIYRDQGLELMNDDVAEITGEVLGTVAEE